MAVHAAAEMDLYLHLCHRLLHWPLESLLWPYILHFVIDIFTRYEGNRAAAWEALQGPIIGGLCLVIFVEIASRTMGFLMAKAVPRLQADIRMAMFDHIQHHSPHYFNERFGGSLANKMTDMTTQVESIIQQLFWPIIPAIATCILGTVFLWFVNPIFAWILFAWIVIHLGVCFKFTPRWMLTNNGMEKRAALYWEKLSIVLQITLPSISFTALSTKKTPSPLSRKKRKRQMFILNGMSQRCSAICLFFILSQLFWECQRLSSLLMGP